MSNLPPPPPPGAVPPPPSYQPMGQTWVQPPVAPPPNKSKATLIGAAVVLLAIVAAGAYFLLKDDDSGPAALSTRQAARNVADLADASKVTSDLYRSDLTACPLGDFKSLVAAGSPDLRDVGDLVTGEGDELKTEVFKLTGDAELTILQCYSNDDSTNTELGVYTAEMNGTAGYRDSLAKLFPTWAFKFEADAAFRGGTFVKYCVSAKDATSTDSPFCETDWITDDLQVGAFVYGDARSTALTTEWLTAILPDVLDNLSGDAFGRITAGEPY